MFSFSNSSSVLSEFDFPYSLSTSPKVFVTFPKASKKFGLSSIYYNWTHILINYE